MRIRDKNHPHPSLSKGESLGKRPAYPSSTDLSFAAKVAYAKLLSYAWHNNLCFPGQDRLAEDMGLTRPRVTQLLSELQSFDLIEIERRGQGETNFYTVNFVVKRKGTKGSNTQK